MAEQGKKVLAIDSDEFLVRIYASKLEQAGYQAEFAVTSQEAEAVLERGLPDVVLLEPMMVGGADGFEFLSKLKSAPDAPVVIVLSKLSKHEDIERALGLGADAYLIKTQVSFQQVIEKVAELTK